MMNDDLTKNTEIARAKFSKAVREYRAKIGTYIDDAEPLPQYLLNGCKVYTDRLTMLESDLFKKNRIWAEIGVDKAEFSKFIIKTLRPSELHLFDMDIGRINYENINDSIQSGQVIIHSGDSSTLLHNFDNDYFDSIYIDGDHHYEGVVKDINVAKYKVKIGGYLIFNDYATWSPGSMSKCGVARAVNQFIINSKSPVIALALQRSGYYDLVVKRV